MTISSAINDPPRHLRGCRNDRCTVGSPLPAARSGITDDGPGFRSNCRPRPFARLAAATITPPLIALASVCELTGGKSSTMLTGFSRTGAGPPTGADEIAHVPGCRQPQFILQWERPATMFAWRHPCLATRLPWTGCLHAYAQRRRTVASSRESSSSWRRFRRRTGIRKRLHEMSHAKSPDVPRRKLP